MNFVLLFFLLLIPLSGFIAWAGDRIGHKIGKRRHSLLGLRPRHTATLMTVVVGMGIALFSFLVMWASVPMFGRVLSEGAALYQANRDLRREIRGLNRSMADLQARRDQVNAEFKLVRRERDEAGRAVFAGPCQLLEVERRPHQPSKDEQGGEEVGREP